MGRFFTRSEGERAERVAVIGTAVRDALFGAGPILWAGRSVSDRNCFR